MGSILSHDYSFRRENAFEAYAARHCKETGNEYFLKGDYAAALKCYTKGMQYESRNSLLFGNRSTVYLKLKCYSNALADAERALEYQPDYTKVLEHIFIII